MPINQKNTITYILERLENFAFASMRNLSFLRENPEFL